MWHLCSPECLISLNILFFKLFWRNTLKLFYQMTSFHYVKIKLKINYCLHNFRMYYMRF